MEELAQAAALYRAGTYRDAALALDNILSEHPEHPGALSLQGLCHIRLGETNAGLEALARAANLAPRDGAILLHFGLGLMAAKQTALAVTLFKQAALLLPFDPAPLLNLASGLLLLGDREGARGAARKAKSRAPHMAEAHYTLGLIDAASDNLPAAAQSFARATALAPDFAEAWLNLGVTRYRQHNMRGARAAMERALAVRPGYAAAETNLAVFDRLDGYPERAQKRLDAVFAADPHNDDARIAQLLALQGQDRAELAMALLEGPPPSDPAAALHWRLQHALVLINLNRSQEARAMLGSLGPIPPAFASLLEFRLALLALDEGEPVRAVAHIETMERQLRETHGMLPEHRLVGWYDLARFWQRQDEPGRAFDAQVEGHRVLGRLQPFSRENYTAFMEATMAAFDRTRLHDGPRAGNRDPAPVFIVGMPRSGTTLAEHILAAHRDVHGAGERSTLNEAFVDMGGGWESEAGVRRIAAVETDVFDRGATAYLDALHALAPGAARVVDKMPANFRLLGFAALLLPSARIISCERDPRDIGASIFQFRFNGHHPYAHDIGDLGWYIGQQRRLMRHWQSVLPLPVLRLRLRDWVDDFDATLRRVLDFLDLPYDPACERFYEQEREVRTASRYQVRVPVNSLGIGRWRAVADRLSPLIAELEAAGEVLDPLD